VQIKTAAQQLVAHTFHTYKLGMLECAPQPFYNHNPERSGAHTPESNHSVLKHF